MAAILTRMTRASLLECVGEDYVRTARAKGVSRARLLGRHALANALGPVVTILGLQFGALLAGTVITETIFSWPGVGRLTIDAINQRDYPVVQGCILLVAAGFVVASALTDLAAAWLDPRMRGGGREPAS
jgi:peptide/nickel transport system permease protein